MEYYHESVSTDGSVPARILVHSVGYVTKHWHNSLELLLVLNGEITVEAEDITTIREGGIIVINTNEIHSISATPDNIVLAIQVRRSFLEKTYADWGDIRINCCFPNESEDPRITPLRRRMAELALLFTKKQQYFEVLALGLLYQILFELTSLYIQTTPIENSRKSEKNIERLSAIIEYIRFHYKDHLTVSKIAESQGISPNYLSAFFQKHMGITLITYISNIRLENAKNDLLDSKASIIDISENNGFPNIKAFYAAFKKTYGTTPNVYRKKKKPLPSEYKSNYLNIESSKIFGALEKYLHIKPKTDEIFLGKSSVTISIDATQNGRLIKHNWRRLITFGKAVDGLTAAIQQQLRDMQRDIGFQYVRFHGLFDDSMLVVCESDEGMQYHFHRIFELFDFLLAIGLKPFMELSFMPSALAKRQKTFFVDKSVISEPKDISLWQQLVRNLLDACLTRYGLIEVQSWYFEFWNEPEVIGFMWNDTQQDYLAFYKATFEVFRATDAHLKIGGPACFSNSMIHGKWFAAYADFVKKENCVPDFLTVHTYPVIWNIDFDELSEQERNISDKYVASFMKISTDPNFLDHTLSELTVLLAKWGFASLPLYITEWNSTVWHRDLCSDTCYKAAYIAKNITETIDKSDGIGFWTISDRMEELFPANTLFHGGLGLMTFNGIKKAGYYSYTLLARLGDRLITTGDGFFVTRNDTGFQILLYNYCHYDDNYCAMDTSFISQTDRYHVFRDEKEKSFEIKMTGLLASQKIRIRETRIGRNNGSAFDAWLLMGAPQQLLPAEIDWLKCRSVPLMTIGEHVADTILNLNYVLKPHEVMLIEI